MPTLRPYQIEALAAIRDARASRESLRGVVAMSTGTGKSVVMAHLPQTLGSERGFLAVHGDELVEQLADHFRRMLGSAAVSIEQGNRTAAPMAPLTVASLDSMTTRRLATMDASRYDWYAMDEVHRGVTKTAIGMWKWSGALNFDGSKAARCKPHLGFTATPARGDGVSLGRVFDPPLVYRYDLARAIDEGYLVPPVCWTVETGISLDGVSMVAGEYNQKELSRAVLPEERNAAVFAEHQKRAKGLRTLVFAVSVEHAVELASHFSARSVPATVVHGTQDKETRRRAFSWFRETSGAVLVNCQIVGEGVDIPGIECIVNAAPVRSSTVFSQRIGRGTRLAIGAKNIEESIALGKPHCVILDVTDSVSDAGKRAVNIMDLFCAPEPEKRLEGADVLKVVREQQKRIEDKGGIVSELATVARRVELFSGTGKNRRPDTTMRWLKYGDGLVMPLPHGRMARVHTDEMLCWSADGYIPGRGWVPATVAPRESRAEVLAAAESAIRAKYPKHADKMSVEAYERRANKIQKAQARRLRMKLPRGCSAGQAADLIATAEIRRGKVGAA